MALSALIPALPILGALVIPFPDELPFTLLRWGFIALCLFLSVLLLSPMFQSPEQHPAIVALRDGRVCWIYVRQSQDSKGRKAGPPALELGTLQGDRLRLPLDEARTDEFIRLLSRTAPHAVVGWSPERELAFLRDPGSLLATGR